MNIREPTWTSAKTPSPLGDEPKGCNAAGGAHTRPSQVNGGRATIVVIEKRPLIRDCLVRSINVVGDFEVLAAATLDECVWLTRDRRALVVLLSLSGSAHSDDNRQAVRQAAITLGGEQLLVLSDAESTPQCVDQSRTSPCGYISTSMPLDVAIAALRVARVGATPPSREGGEIGGASGGSGHEQPPCTCCAPATDASMAESPAENKFAGMFTKKQIAVVEALRKGKANKIIAYELDMKESTVKVHVRNIMKRLNATNRTEVSYIAARLEAGTFRNGQNAVQGDHYQGSRSLGPIMGARGLI